MDKFKALLQSRKFWALIAALAAALTGYLSGAITPAEAVQAAIAALAAYMVGTGLDNGQPPAVKPDHKIVSYTKYEN